MLFKKISFFSFIIPIACYGAAASLGNGASNSSLDNSEDDTVIGHRPHPNSPDRLGGIEFAGTLHIPNDLLPASKPPINTLS